MSYLNVISPAAAAAQRAVLGITDLTGMDASELAHANAVCNFANPSLGIKIRMGSKLGTQGNWWRQNLGTSGTQTTPTTGRGDGLTLSTGASSTTMNGQLTSDGSVFGAPLINDLVLSSSRWHIQWDFAYLTTPTANSYLNLGWVASNGGFFGPSVGVFGAGSTTKYGIAAHNAATFTPSTITIDANVHRAQVWANGGTPGTVFFRIDQETPIAITGVTAGSPVSPYWEFKCTDTGAAQQATLKTSYYRVDGELP